MTEPTNTTAPALEIAQIGQDDATYGMALNRVMDAAEYDSVSGYYDSDDSEMEHWRFWEWVANGLARYHVTGDTTHVNRLVRGARHTGRFTNLQRVIKPLVAHAYDKDANLYGGAGVKQDAAKSKRLRTIIDGVQVWEQKFVEFLEKEDKHSKRNEKKDWSLDSAVVRLVNRANKECYSKTQLLAAVDKALSA